MPYLRATAPCSGSGSAGKAAARSTKGRRSVRNRSGTEQPRSPHPREHDPGMPGNAQHHGSTGEKQEITLWIALQNLVGRADSANNESFLYIKDNLEIGLFTVIGGWQTALEKLKVKHFKLQINPQDPIFNMVYQEETLRNTEQLCPFLHSKLDLLIKISPYSQINTSWNLRYQKKKKKQTHLAKTLNSVLSKGCLAISCFTCWAAAIINSYKSLGKSTCTNRNKTNSHNSIDNLYSHEVL